MNTTYNIESIIAATTGRKMHTHDSWNGSSMTITVETAEQLSNQVVFTGTNAWGGKSGIYVDNECVAPLILTGNAERVSEIECCTVRKKWTLK